MVAEHYTAYPDYEERDAEVVTCAHLEVPNVLGEGPPERQSRGGNPPAQLVGGPSRPAG